MNFKVAVVILINTLLTACGQNISITAPSILITKPPSEATVLSPTFELVSTSTPSLTLPPPLSEEGPYLLLHKGLSDGIVVYDIQGFGRKTFEELNLNTSVYYNPYLLNDLVSPDGQWFAYHFYEGKTESLNLFNLSNEIEVRITEVFPDDSIQRLKEVEKQLPGMYPDLFSTDEDVSVEMGFREGIHKVAWSPNGRHLAFAAQIDGLSSDVYVYDLETRNIRRLNDDLLSVQYISWSPDGQYILFINDIPGSIYSGSSLHVLPSNAIDIKNPDAYKSGNWWLTVGWLSSKTIFIAHHGDGGSWYDLSYFDIETKQMRSLWPGSFESFDVDIENQKIILSTEDGLYFIDLDGNARMVSESVYWYVTFRGGSKFRFLANDGEKIFGIFQDGTASLLSNKGLSPLWSISPDYQWLVVYDTEGLELFDAQNELIKTISITTKNISWNPDSSGFFLSSWDKLYYVKVPSSELTLVDHCQIRDCDFELFESIWLP